LHSVLSDEESIFSAINPQHPNFIDKLLLIEEQLVKLPNYDQLASPIEVNGGAVGKLLAVYGRLNVRKECVLTPALALLWAREDMPQSFHLWQGREKNRKREVDLRLVYDQLDSANSTSLPDCVFIDNEVVNCQTARWQELLVDEMRFKVLPLKIRTDPKRIKYDVTVNLHCGFDPLPMSFSVTVFRSKKWNQMEPHHHISRATFLSTAGEYNYKGNHPTADFLSTTILLNTIRHKHVP